MSRAKLARAIEATRKEDYLRALTMFLDFYGEEGAPRADDAKAANGLSFFGLCLALVQKDYKAAVELCERAIALQFYNGDHFENLARVYLASGKRRKAIETAEQGLKSHEDHEGLKKVRQELGIRARPAVPFLDRSHPLNVTIGQKRHAKKLNKDERKKG